MRAVYPEAITPLTLTPSGSEVPTHSNQFLHPQELVPWRAPYLSDSVPSTRDAALTTLIPHGLLALPPNSVPTTRHPIQPALLSRVLNPLSAPHY